MLAPNSTLQNGRYRIIDHLGDGGPGNVYEAHDTRSLNRVVIKEALGNDPTSPQIFKKEFMPERDLAPRSANLAQSWALGRVMALLLGLIVVGLALMSCGNPPIITFTVSEGTPLPQSLAVISDENASKLRQIASWGKTSISGGVAYSPDGKWLAASLSIGIHLYDAETLQEVRILDSQGWINGIAFSPDSTLLAVNGPQKSIQLWQVSDGQLLATFKAHTNRVSSISFSPDGQLLAFAGCREIASNGPCLESEIQLSRVSDGQLLTTLDPHTSYVSSVSFSPDGELLASAGCREIDGSSCVAGEVQLWRVSDRQLLNTLEGHNGTVLSVSFSPDGQRLASAGCRGTEDFSCMAGEVRLWRVSDGQLLATLEGHTSGVSSVSFSADGEQLTSASWDQTVRLWRVSDGQLLATIEGSYDPLTKMSFSPDGERLASVSSDSKVRLLRVSDGELLATLEGHTDAVRNVSFSPDGERLASAFASNVSGSNNHTVRVSRVSDGQLLATLQGHTAEVTSVSFSPDGERLASSSWDSTVRLWQVSDGQVLATLQGHTAEVTNVSFSPDGQQLASASSDSTVRLWAVSDGPPLHILEGHTGSVNSVSFSPDGQQLASASNDNTVRLWRVSDGQLLATLEGHTHGVLSVSFSPDGKSLASTSGRLELEVDPANKVDNDHELRLWQVSDGQLLATLEGHTDDVTSVSFNPDGQLLASASEDQTVRLWRVSDGQLLATSKVHIRDVKSVSFSPDGRLLASGSRDGTIGLFGVVE